MSSNQRHPKTPNKHSCFSPSPPPSFTSLSGILSTSPAPTTHVRPCSRGRLQSSNTSSRGNSRQGLNPSPENEVESPAPALFHPPSTYPINIHSPLSRNTSSVPPRPNSRRARITSPAAAISSPASHDNKHPNSGVGSMRMLREFQRITATHDAMNAARPQSASPTSRSSSKKVKERRPRSACTFGVKSSPARGDFVVKCVKADGSNEPSPDQYFIGGTVCSRIYNAARGKTGSSYTFGSRHTKSRGDFVLRDTIKSSDSGNSVGPGKYNTQQNAQRYNSSSLTSRVKGGRFYRKRSEKAGDFIIGVPSGLCSPGPARYDHSRNIKPTIEPGKSFGQHHSSRKGCLVVR